MFYLIGIHFNPWFGYQGNGLIPLLNILILSLYIGQGPILLGAFFSGILWDLLFVPPVLSFTIAQTEDLELLITYFLIASVIGILSSRVKRKRAFIKY